MVQRWTIQAKRVPRRCCDAPKSRRQRSNWVIRSTVEMSARCPLSPQLPTYSCADLSVAEGPIGDIEWVPLTANVSEVCAPISRGLLGGFELPSGLFTEAAPELTGSPN